MSLAVASRNTLAATVFLMLLVVAFATRSPMLLALYTLSALTVVLTNVEVLSRMRGKERDMATVLVAVLTVMLPISAFRSESALAHYVGVLLSLGAAYVLTRDLNVYLDASRLSLLAAQSAVAVYLGFSGLEDFPLENMLPDSSSNGVTSYLVLLQANYCIVNFLLRRRSSVATSLITLGICIVGYGRGSLLAAGGIVALNLLFSVSLKSRKHAVLGALLLLCVGVGVYVAFNEEIVTFIEINTKIGVGLEDEPRERIISDYLGKLDELSFLIGADYRGTTIDLDYFGNPHISYIRAHHIFGLPYLAVMLALPLVMLWQGHAVSVKVFCGLMLVLILFRAFTEPILFPTLFDLYYFAICFALSRRVPIPALRSSKRVN